MKNIRTIVIAAAGRGTRMQQLSADKPKHLIRVMGKPFLQIVLEHIRSLGFERIILVVGYKAEQMQQFVETLPFSVEVVNQNTVVPNKYGTACVVEAAKTVLGNEEPFILQNGDSLYSTEVYERLIENVGGTQLLGAYHEDPSQYGVLDLTADMQLKQIIEKPAEPICNIINLGLYAFQPSIFAAVDQVQKSERGEYEIIDAINLIAQHEIVTVHRVDGQWIDLGKPEDLPIVEQFIIDHQLV